MSGHRLAPPLLLALAATSPAAATDSDRPAASVTLSAEVVQPLMPALARGRNLLIIRLAGSEARTPRREPVNVAIVVDRSASMQGEKLALATMAATRIVELLHPDDFLAIVAYDSGARVMLPSTKLADKRDAIIAIEALVAADASSLTTGVESAAGELRKLLSYYHFNRIYLVSDGRSNFGPRDETALSRLEDELRVDGISITTLSVGEDRNLDLMTRLAVSTGGRHIEVNSGADLTAGLMADLGEGGTVVAQEIEVGVRFPEGVTPVRVLGHGVSLAGREVVVRADELLDIQEKTLMVALDVGSMREGSELEVASLSGSYVTGVGAAPTRLSALATVRFEEPGPPEAGPATDVPGPIAPNERRLGERHEAEAATRAPASPGPPAREGNPRQAPLDSDEAPGTTDMESLAQMDALLRWNIERIARLDVRRKHDDSMTAMRELVTCIGAFWVDFNRVPDDLDGLVPEYCRNGRATDGWGNSIVYIPKDDRSGFQLLSPGQDGKLGTADDYRNVDFEFLEEVDPRTLVVEPPALPEVAPGPVP